MRHLKWLFVVMLLGVFSVVNAQIAGPNLPVKSYVLMDAKTGQILAAKEPDLELPPASITKLMTAYVTFEALKNGKIHLDDNVTISHNAYSQPGSRMFVEVNSQVSVENLLKGMIVQSGNDAAVALAEYVAGSTDGFVALMNQAAQKLNLQHTHYVDVNGLPVPNHFTTARDIALLDRAIIHEFPEYYPYFAIKTFTWNKITQNNRNKLLWRDANVDGLKTGHTEAAGYCLTTSAKRGNMRLITVVLGADNEEERYRGSQQLLNFGFSQFSEVSPLPADKVLASPRVYKGAANEVPVVAQKSVSFLIENALKNKLSASLNLHDTIVAPIAKGQELGTIDIKNGDKVYASVPAVAEKAIAKGGFFKRQMDGLKLWWKNR